MRTTIKILRQLIREATLAQWEAEIEAAAECADEESGPKKVKQLANYEDGIHTGVASLVHIRESQAGLTLILISPAGSEIVYDLTRQTQENLLAIRRFPPGSRPVENEGAEEIVRMLNRRELEVSEDVQPVPFESGLENYMMRLG